MWIIVRLWLEVKWWERWGEGGGGKEGEMVSVRWICSFDFDSIVLQ